MRIAPWVTYLVLAAAAAASLGLSALFGSVASQDAADASAPKVNEEVELPPLRASDGINGVVHRGFHDKGGGAAGTDGGGMVPWSTVDTTRGEVASTVNPFHAAALAGRLGTGGSKWSGDGGSGGAFSLSLSDDDPQSAKRGGRNGGGGGSGGEDGGAGSGGGGGGGWGFGGGGVEGKEEGPLEDKPFTLEDYHSMDAALASAEAGGSSLDGPGNPHGRSGGGGGGGGGGGSSSGARGSASAAPGNHYTNCSRVKCEASGFSSHIKADLWGGTGVDDGACASKAAVPLDGLCLAGGGTFHAAQVRP